MESPFIYGTPVTGEYFTDREEELGNLFNNFSNNRNTIIISPRRYGKTSLVKQAIDLFKRDHERTDIKFCYLDLFKARSEEAFINMYSSEVIKATSSKFDDWINTAKTFFKKLVPKVSLGGDAYNEFSLSFEYSDTRTHIEEILDLPERIAAAQNIRIIVCIDEFQNLMYFRDPLVFQKQLRAFWQHHQKTSYVLFGSKKHMMTELFQEQSMPFYRFGDYIFLQKIDGKKLCEHLISSFTESKKSITARQAELIVKLVSCHPYYVQQFSEILWNRTDTSVTDDSIGESLEVFLKQNMSFFQRTIDDLTNPQLNFLCALASGEKKLSSSEVINTYKLGSTANVNRIKDALLKKEVLNRKEDQLEFIDPAFELLLKKYILGTSLL